MSINSAALGTPRNITTTTLLSTVGCGIVGFFVGSTSTGTIQFYDSSTAATNNAISGVITPAAGAFYPFPAATSNGLYAVIANTLNVTIFTV